MEFDSTYFLVPAFLKTLSVLINIDPYSNLKGVHKILSCAYVIINLVKPLLLNLKIASLTKMSFKKYLWVLFLSLG